MSRAVLGDRARTLVVTLSVLSLVGVVVAMVYGRKLSPRPVSTHDSYGRGPLNTRVFVEALPRLGVTVERLTALREVRTTTRPVFFLAPDAPAQTIDGRVHTLREVLDARYEAGLVSVVVLPKWALAGGLARPLDATELEDYLEAVDLGLEVTHVGAVGETPTPTSLSAGSIVGGHVELSHMQLFTGAPNILASVEGGALAVSDAESRLFVVSDGDLFANFSVHRSDHARLAVELVRRIGGGRVAVDETFHGRHAERRLAEVLGEWPGVLVLVQGALLVAAVMLRGRVRFGRPQAARKAYGRGPREAIAVAADVLSLGRAPGRLAARYVDLLLRDVHRRTMGDRGAPQPSLSTVDAARALDDAAARRGRPREAGALLASASAMMASAGQRTPSADALALARRAHAYRRRQLGQSAEGGPT